MPLELSSDRAVCTRCGMAFGKRRGSFPVCYGESYKGAGFLHVCKSCVDNIYNGYLSQCGDAANAVRQTCRKLDLYWNDGMFQTVMKKSTPMSVMSQYIARINAVKYSGKSYDDTLLAEGTMWDFAHVKPAEEPPAQPEPEPEEKDDGAPAVEEDPVPDDIVSFWGPGYTGDVYRLLDQRYHYYLSRLPDETIDIGKELLLKTVSMIEYDINRCIADGKPVDKQMATLNNTLDSLHLKPKQQKQEEISDALNATPMGVWIDRFEHHKPLPDTDEALKDRAGIMKYVFVWLGHVLEMLGKKNPYKELYDEEMEKYRVEPPVYDGDDDDEQDDEE